MSDEPSTTELGRVGEDRAASWLERHGLELLDRNVTCGGVEIDLVFREPLPEGWVCVFVEVRGRSDDRLGHPLETIDRSKRARLRRGASAYLIERGLWERVAVRFDVIAIVGDGDPIWIRDAF
ncbi:MAG: YraN family protein [Deltaproteobacteria bacterium]|nr:YraN family protein [Deltaproteobacteria bacterium]